MNTDFWEPHYQRMSIDWGTKRNHVLAEVMTDLDIATQDDRAKTALDLGAGHGGDACWLAAQGWTVTAVDLSPTAISRVVQLAESRGIADRVRTEDIDLTKSMPRGNFDLITASYFYVDSDRPEVLRRAWRQLAPDGLLVIIDHASVAPWSWTDPDTQFPTPQETLDKIDIEAHTLADRAMRIELLRATTYIATGPDGSTANVVDNVVVIRSTTGHV